MITFYTLCAVYFVFHGAIHGRLDGGGIAQTKEWVERLLVMSGFVIACAPVAGPWSLLALIGTFGIATGHGQYFPDMNPQKLKPEFFDFLIRPFFGEDPRVIGGDIKKYGRTKLRTRNAAGMFATGAIVGLPAFILLAVFGKIYAGFFLLTGPAKAASYLFCKNTEMAEYANGALRNLICLLVIACFYSKILAQLNLI